MAEKKAAENVVFVGIKPVMNYVLAVITQFNMGAMKSPSRHEAKPSARPSMSRR